MPRRSLELTQDCVSHSYDLQKHKGEERPHDVVIVALVPALSEAVQVLSNGRLAPGDIVFSQANVVAGVSVWYETQVSGSIVSSMTVSCKVCPADSASMGSLLRVAVALSGKKPRKVQVFLPIKAHPDSPWRLEVGCDQEPSRLLCKLPAVCGA